VVGPNNQVSPVEGYVAETLLVAVMELTAHIEVEALRIDHSAHHDPLVHPVSPVI